MRGRKRIGGEKERKECNGEVITERRKKLGMYGR